MRLPTRVVGANVASTASKPSTEALLMLTAANESVCHSCKTAVAEVLPIEFMNGVSVGEML